MIYEIFADAVVVAHLCFILFAVLGGLLVWRWKRLAWIHVPTFFWAMLIEWLGRLCPLTPLENLLRQRGGASGYETSFIAHYILPIIYPPGLTRPVQLILGFLVLAINCGIYGWIFRQKRKN